MECAIHTTDSSTNKEHELIVTIKNGKLWNSTGKGTYVFETSLYIYVISKRYMKIYGFACIISKNLYTKTILDIKLLTSECRELMADLTPLWPL